MSCVQAGWQPLGLIFGPVTVRLGLLTRELKTRPLSSQYTSYQVQRKCKNCVIFRIASVRKQPQVIVAESVSASFSILEKESIPFPFLVGGGGGCAVISLEN